MIFDKIEARFCKRNEQFENVLQRYCPPGYELKGEYRMFWAWLTVAVFYSMQFFINYYNAYENLFYYSGRVKVLNMTMRIQGFRELLAGSFDLFFLGAAFLGIVFILHYDYYRKQSKSIYLMKRLPDQKLLNKTYHVTPLIYGLIFLITGLILLAVYYMIYRLVTPQICLPM